MIKIKKLSKNFGDVEAVSDVSFEVSEPQMIGIIGRSGAGKSTLLRMINRLVDASDGDVFYQNENVTKYTGSKKRKWQSDCAMIFQQFNLVPRLDVLTNVILGRLNEQSTLRSILAFFSKVERDEALSILDRFGIIETALQRAETLSGGQQQRVAICRAIMQKPKMLLADEPIASLDPLNAQIVMDSLQRIHREENISILCNLHTLDTAKSYCDRIIGMREGKVIFDDDPQKLNKKKAKEIYGAEELSEFESSVTSTRLG